MAKQKRTLPAPKHRPRPRAENAILLQSAEALGRMIGALQRQLDEATERLAGMGHSRASRPDGDGSVPDLRAAPRRSGYDVPPNGAVGKKSARARAGSRRASANGRPK